MEVVSFSSYMDNTLYTSLASSTVLAKIPTVSKEFAYATNPHREHRPYEGLNPTTPQYEAGSLTDPPVSDPNAAKHIPLATEAADPPELPPAIRAVSLRS